MKNMTPNNQFVPSVVDLSGPDGNAYTLLIYTIRWCKQLGKDWKTITNDMTSKDYNHLVSVVDMEFGKFVTFLH
jgi:hypothetical protein